jgi:hypothetical protein
MAMVSKPNYCEICDGTVEGDFDVCIACHERPVYDGGEGLYDATADRAAQAGMDKNK